ncbi:MAG: hypothetical protein JW741_20435 [Sedimentisphaerales bacterium]|nr:hypothetical protein [Sedimentisphaerales bacterium]
MRTSVTVAVLSVLILVAGGCEEPSRQASTVAPDVPAVASEKPQASGTLTLSVEQLAMLDWSRPAASRPKVVARRVVKGVGVDFDIQFPSNRPGSRAIDYISSGSGGRGAMIGLDVQGYEAFALKFTLLSVDRAAGSALPHQVVVGALFGPTGDGKIFGYEPLSLSFASNAEAGVAQTPLASERINQIGFHVHMANPQVWDPHTTVLTLRVEPAPGAAVLDTTSVVQEEPQQKSRSGPRTTESPDMGPARLGAW